MSAPAKLRSLVYGWVAYAAFASLLEIVTWGFDAGEVAVRIGLAYGIAWVVSRQLARKSSLTWALAVAFSFLSGIAGLIRILEILLNNQGEGFIELARALAWTLTNYYMFRVLRSREVKRFVMLDE